MTAGSPQRPLVLTLPPALTLARLARLAALHFLRQNGMKVMTARRAARAVEKRCRTLLRAAGRPRGSGQGRPLTLVLASDGDFLEITARPARAGGASSSLVRLRRPAGS
jgi:hypothetical protein